MAKAGNSKNKQKLQVKEKIDHILDEIRVVLPGTQALMGFQLSAFFSNGFVNISTLLKQIHLLSLGLILISIMFLMTPVAYHQIVDRGEDTERFHTFSQRILILTLIFLGLGLSADVYVVTEITTKSPQIALFASVSLLLIFYFFWFGYTFFKRNKK